MNEFDIIYYKTICVIPIFFLLIILIRRIVELLNFEKTIFLIGVFLLFHIFIEFIYFGNHNAYEWVTSGDIPILLRMLDQNYLNNDFYTNSIFLSPKIVFYYIVYFSIKILGVDMSTMLFAFKSIQIYLIPFLSFILLSNNIHQKNILLFSFSISLVLLFCLGYFSFVSIIAKIGVDSFINWKNLSPQSFALTIGLFGLLLFQKKYVKSSIFIFLIVSLIHIFVGFIFMILVHFLTKEIKINNFFAYNLMKIYKSKYIYAISFILPFIIIYFLFNNEVPENIIESYVYERHPHHYLLSSFFNIFSLIFIILPLILICFGYYIRNLKIIYDSITVMIFVNSCLLIQYIGTEIYVINFIVILGPIRFLSITIFLYMYIFINAVNCLKFK